MTLRQLFPTFCSLFKSPVPLDFCNNDLLLPILLWKQKKMRIYILTSSSSTTNCTFELPLQVTVFKNLSQISKSWFWKPQGLLTKAFKSSLVLPFILNPKSNLSVIVDRPVFKICLSLDDCWLFCLFYFDQSCCGIIFLFSLTQWNWCQFF